MKDVMYGEKNRSALAEVTEVGVLVDKCVPELDLSKIIPMEIQLQIRQLTCLKALHMYETGSAKGHAIPDV